MQLIHFEKEVSLRLKPEWLQRKESSKAHPDANVVVKPLADGGEGTTDALIAGLGGERIDLTVTGPLGTPVNAHYGYLAEKILPSSKWLPLPELSW